ncbi:transcriptional regulator [Candidatus Saccharibacteria bacterium]|nr:transcriptional regulator [Candidatus Saccharibacteria bacterium]
MFEQLFGSKTRVKLLSLFYENPNRSFYVREITRKIDEQINSVRRELANLLSIGIITSDANNNRLYYEVDQKYKYYRPLAAIFSGKTLAPTSKDETKAQAKKESVEPKVDELPETPLAKGLRSTGHVELAVLTGQFTRDEIAGVDLVVVGDINQAKIDRFVEELEKSENKQIRYTVMTLPDYKYRQQIKDRFVTHLLEAKKQVIINTQDLPV